ncbi:hypothetical protein C1J03_09740 [Sulfitobacter sp. SK012]|uniref:DUF2950 family protein n=1 Tax=Sulfitobacter sp. SK012 TaxID=1389005 RepID=UPI000E0B327F|nr:DUF2950 family protein [Sulfitobacter sp. SK012]AXI46282.1 hypothetical protein C1J03_09740 [Sulfitobacter sp. SK012]
MESKKMKIFALASLMIFGNSAFADVSGQKAGYATSEQLAGALVSAIRSQSAEQMEDLFGTGALDVMTTGETFEDRAILESFTAAYDEEHFVQEIYGKYAVLLIGEDNWAFPMPMMRNEDGLWVFDVEEGLEEMANREIGRNEIETIEILKSYSDAQAAYRSTDWDGDGVLEFASTVISSEGEKDGLYWPGVDSPAGELFARASANGYVADGEEQAPEPYEGYVYRMFSSQSDAASGGAMDYVVNGHQVAGHAAMAVPAEYGVTGIMSFMVSENGIILEQDLGDDGLDMSFEMKSFDPSEGWVPLPSD